MESIVMVIITRDEDGHYIAECPKLPGCVSQGETIEEAQKNIKEAIEGWLYVDGLREDYNE